MYLVLICLAVLLEEGAAVVGGEMEGASILDCSSIVRSCQTHCDPGEAPDAIVRWVVENGAKVRCAKHAMVDEARPTTSNPTAFFTTTFDVICCPNKSEDANGRENPTTTEENLFNNDLKNEIAIMTSKLDRSFILSLAILASLVLVSVTILVVFLYHSCKSDRKVKLRKGGKSKKKVRPLLTSSEKTTTAASATVQDFTNETKGESLNQEQSSSTKLLTSPTTSPTTSSDGYRVSLSSDLSKGKEGDSLARAGKPQNLTLRGGFVTATDPVDPTPKQFVAFKEEGLPGDFPDRIIVKSEKENGLGPLGSLVPAGAEEGDYVQAPPLKSQRCQKREVQPEYAYNKILPTNQKQEPGDYSMLQRNPAMSMTEQKTFLIMSTRSNENDKSDVTINKSGDLRTL
ncbi:uncharacterized protein LOC143449437 [Clavelina lepadiformis]|uniref:uncharacterized protein LOC143449437 n=1 Tax=Clavelina lepadiformis TaxID=159417 RepID=UPI004043507C